ncbi:flagellar basal body rod protein [Alicyclobacillus cycloheptanicus]|uniref:Flagellar basal body rod protein FlgG n=1 Tax=Alicyclobacillus cycloheptanicus TaxID=1457 RepID=A0ABT9XGG5_9BACL|nr:flagellar basal body rod C-terminal domain-containing protein [Alicyclobacillus cycloheptanicus]MDQ0189396.1 flagellar basal body rod protein FlgG [Alicyclobacillus cycloheptanicus]WDM02272.1 flagellar basal body rod protein [Alicyclobacillus cycloheptanicus]
MLRGLTTAASGMLADERLQQLLANNLANAETPGFKSSDGQLTEFPQQLIENINSATGQSSGTVGQIGTGVVMQQGVPIFSEGSLTSTGRNLDVAITDNTPAGTYAAVAGPGGANAGQGANGGLPVSVNGTVTVGANNILSINGQPLAVLDSAGDVMPGVYAARNPAYQGSALYAANGSPNYDSNGNPSYVFVNAAGQTVGSPADTQWEGAGLRIGDQDDMGLHSFYPVDFQSPYSPSGIVLTRDGSLSVNSNHELVDAAGNAILAVGANGLPIPGAHIVINTNYQGTDLFSPTGGPVVDQNGQPSYRVIGANGTVIPGARLGTVDADVTQLQPLGQTEFQVGQSLTTAQVMAQLRPGTGSIHPGELEQSNVDVTTTMTQMMQVMNQYQANQEVVKTEDAMLGLATSDVGKVSG